MNMHAAYTPKRFTSDSRGVVVTDVVVLAIGQVQDIERDIEIVGNFAVHTQVGGHAGAGAHSVVFDQRCRTNVANTQRARPRPQIAQGEGQIGYFLNRIGDVLSLIHI